MATALMGKDLAPSFGPALGANRIAGGFAGDLSSLSAFELLQVFQYLGKSGKLWLECRGEEARCEVAPRGLHDVECGPLRGWDAALAFVWWKEGSFRFETRPASPAFAGREPLAVQQLLLDAVQLADEIEARTALIPARGEPLYRLLLDPLLPALRNVRGSAEVLDHLAAHPGASRRDLEQSLPFSPVTLGFAVARLVEEGCVGARERRSGKPAATPADPAAPRIVRALFAFDPEHAEEADAALHGIEERLGAARSSGQVEAATPTFLRTRLPSGCFLSLTALPISRRNRFVLESLAPSLALAVLRTGGRCRDEIERWQALLPPGVEVVLAESVERAAREIVSSVRLLEGGEGATAGTIQ